jgi:hypothetical protein
VNPFAELLKDCVIWELGIPVKTYHNSLPFYAAEDWALERYGNERGVQRITGHQWKSGEFEVLFDGLRLGVPFYVDYRDE